ncbi:MAG: asparagine synthase (glutamine-hydrolyzing) [Candidatus Syntrophosphaera sp.]|mgnify:CR=1 FL=1|jgi:asparagine synthase (glutamine-hydrolysing)|nr:asparagine synthase (glutamine-hydrolyzing) [Candidatus Cloacimonadota bacterium]MDY0111581.1 asparagine synthase (glutamine-hydrolyzing) [Candidatus Syntrophosphaera sp.]
MCGISGIYSFNSQRSIDISLLKAMNDLIKHRGPDDEGFCLMEKNSHKILPFSGSDSKEEICQLYPPLNLSTKAFLGFGFRRLAIIDLSVKGHQPMSDHQLKLHIVFNGEIYNYIELRRELITQGYTFNTESDTEVILKAYDFWGENCVLHFNGIWAFALYDTRKNMLFCSRDRLGVKPFYYCQDKDFLYFASEIKQLLLTPIDKSFNLPSIWRSTKLSFMPVYGDENYWKEIKTLQPGFNLIVNQQGITLRQYYQLDPATFGKSTLSFAEATQMYRATFEKAVQLQMRTDVEVGSCLSGGLDSSAIVCTASKFTNKPLQTFSAYFPEYPPMDERIWIEEVVKSCSCVSHLISPKAEDALNWFDEATWYNDIPLGSGYAAQYAVMKLGQENGIKVLLDGQGSDEVNAGYRHAFYSYLADIILQAKFQKAMQETLAWLKKYGWKNGLPGLVKAIICIFLSDTQLYNYEFKLLHFEPFNQDFIKQCKKSLSEPIMAQISGFSHKNIFKLSPHQRNNRYFNAKVNKVSAPSCDKLSNFLYNAVYTTSLPTLLHWEDRMAMAASIENRVPFLDHNLVELVFSLPSEYKIHNAQGKYVHRQAIKPLVPPAIIDRKDKSIFGSPFSILWLRGPLKNTFEELITSSTFRQRGIWNLPSIWKNWQKYLNGDNSQADMIFSIFALEMWFRRFS